MCAIIAREHAIPAVARRSLAAHEAPQCVLEGLPGPAFMFIANLADIIAEEHGQFVSPTAQSIGEGKAAAEGEYGIDFPGDFDAR